jgi:hypothetical protein
MVWVEKDVAGVAKGVFDNWDRKKDELRYRHLYAMDAVHTPREICEVIQRGKCWARAGPRDGRLILFVKQ